MTRVRPQGPSSQEVQGHVPPPPENFEKYNVEERKCHFQQLKVKY